MSEGNDKKSVPVSAEPEARPERSSIGSAPSPQTLSQHDADLRRLAEDLARENTTPSPDDTQTLSPEETRRLLHDLRVHQIQLEMQNDELRRSQAELDASRQRYFDLYDLAPVGYFTLSEPGLILQTNLTAAGLLGLTREALVQQPLTRFILPEDQDIFYRHCRRLFETGLPQACQMRMLRANADPFWVRLEATVVRDADETAYGRAVMSDITKQKQIELSLRDSEERFRITFAQAAVGIAHVAPDGRFLRLNQRFCDIIGYSQYQMLERSFQDITHPEDLNTDLDHVRRLLAGQAETYAIDKRYFHKSG